jgi:hypothetical protein
MVYHWSHPPVQLAAYYLLDLLSQKVYKYSYILYLVLDRDMVTHDPDVYSRSLGVT